jgi:hypothetical protein
MEQRAYWPLVILCILAVVLTSAGCAWFRSCTNTRPRIITSTGTTYSNPLFTFDGNHIIFVACDSSTSICICGIDGSNVRILAQFPKSEFPDVTSDGQFAIFSSFRSQQNDIFRLNLVTGELLNLTDCQADDDWLVLSPDDSHIAYIRSDEPVYETTVLSGEVKMTRMKKHKKSFLMVMNIDGSNKEVVAERGWDPRWSPDGKHIAYRVKKAAHLWSLDGSDEIVNLNGGIYAWGCDSNTVFYFSFRRANIVKRLMNRWFGGIDEFHDLHITKLDRTEDYQLLSNNYAEIACHTKTNRIALAAFPYLGKISYDGIIMIDCSGAVVGDYRQEGPGFEYGSISWSSDGQLIAFSRRTRDWIADPALGGIFIMSADGKQIRQIQANKIIWSSD